MSVTADFDAATAAERELVLRLASPPWRLRRSLAVETGLLQIRSEIIKEAKSAQAARAARRDDAVDEAPHCCFHIPLAKVAIVTFGK